MKHLGLTKLPKVPPLLILVVLAVIVRVLLWGWFMTLPPTTEKGGKESSPIANVLETSSKSPLRIWDEREYDNLATNLCEYGEFSYKIGEPASLRPPLYPFFLSFVYQILGLKSYQAARALQAVLSLVTIFLVYDLGTRVYDRETGSRAAVFYAFYPSLLIDNNLILTEVLFTFFLTAAVWSLVRGFQASSVVWVLGSGVLFGLGALTRSVLWVFIPVLSVYVLVFWNGNWKGRLLASGSLFLAAVLTIAPWAVRNTRLEKTFLAIDSMGGRNLMMGNYEYTPPHRSWDAISIGGESSWDAVLGRAVPASLSATQGQKDKIAMGYALKFVLSHPVLTAQRDVVKFFDFWGLEREQVAGASRGYFGPIPRWVVFVLATVIVGSYVAGLFLGIFGALVTPPSDRRAFGLMLLVIAFICAMHTLTFGHSRYHLPLMPLILTFGAAAAVNGRAALSSLRRWPFWMATGLCGMFVLAWAWDLYVVESGKLSELLSS